MTRFVVVRHGSTGMNEQNLLIGHLDPPLSEIGKKQAERLGRALTQERFDLIVTSDLKRTQETAAIIRSYQAKSVRTLISPELREIDYGDHVGKEKETLRQEEPRYHADPDYQHPGGESFLQLQERVNAVLKRLEGEYERVLVVTHAGALRALYAAYRGEPFARHINLKVPHTTILRLEKTTKPIIETA